MLSCEDEERGADGVNCTAAEVYVEGPNAFFSESKVTNCLQDVPSKTRSMFCFLFLSQLELQTGTSGASVFVSFAALSFGKMQLGAHGIF